MIAGYYRFFIGQRQTTENDKKKKIQLYFSIRIPRFVYRRRSVFISQIQVDEPPKEHVYLINNVGIFGNKLSAVFWKKFRTDDSICFFRTKPPERRLWANDTDPSRFLRFCIQFSFCKRPMQLLCRIRIIDLLEYRLRFTCRTKRKILTYANPDATVKTNCNKNIFSTAVSGKKFYRNKASRKYNVYLCVKISLVKWNARIIKFFFTKSFERFLN